MAARFASATGSCCRHHAEKCDPRRNARRRFRFAHSFGSDIFSRYCTQSRSAGEALLGRTCGFGAGGEVKGPFQRWFLLSSAKPRPLRARRPKLKPSQPYVGGGIDCQILTSAPAAWSEPARPSARRCSAQAAHRLVSVSSLASGSTERAHRRHFQVITATTLRRIQRPRPDRSEVAAPF